MDQVKIFDTTLRDGEQSPGCSMNLKEKIEVARCLEKLKATRIIVAHRLSTIRGCDRILVMDEGRIAENGSFDELVSQGGIFAELVKRQVL